MSSESAPSSEDRWKIAIECVGDGVWDWDCASGTIYFSPQWKAMLGYEDHEIRDSFEEWMSRVHPDDVADCVASWQKHTSKQTPTYESIHRIRTKSGKYKWVLDRGKVLSWNPDGTPLRVVGTHTDIDERKRTEAELADQKHQLLAFIENAPVPVAMFDRDMRYVACSKQWADQYHVDSKSLTGKIHYEVDPTIPEKWRLAHQRCQQGACERHDEELHLTADGQEHWIRWECRPWVQGEKEIGGIVLFAEDVTERRETAIELENQKRVLASILDSSTTGIWDWDLESDYLRLNPRLKRICGYEDDEFPDGPGLWQKMILPDDEPKRLAGLAKHVASHGNTPFSEVLRYRHKSGSQITVICTGTVIRWTDDQKPKRMVGCHIDITHQFQTREELARTREFLEQTNRAARVGGWEVDLLSNSIYWSDITREIHEVGLDYQPNLESGIAFYKQGWSRDRIRELHNRAVMTGLSYDEELELITARGNTRWVRAVGHPEFRAGRCVRVYGAFLDIHESKQVRESLAAQEQRFRGLYELSPVGIAMSDFETGKIIEFNEAMIQPGGYTAAELKGMTYSDLIPQEMHPDWLNAGLRLHEHGRFGPVEVEFLRKDGSRYPVMMNGFLLKSSSSKTVVWSIVEDITERKAVELKLRAAIDAAETANAAKSAFLAMMSHEIRTPLNGIIGSADLLERSGLSEEQKELTHTIQSSGESLLTVINDVLDYSKIEAGRLDVESIPVSPIGLLTDVVNLLRPSATNKALALRTHIEPTVPETIYGDPTRIKQILINLIGNAIKFTQCGSVSIQVSNPGPDSLRFEVTDTGLGIENSRIETLFEAFTQADSSTTRKYGGTGLGLAISKKLVQLMSGSIGVESVLGHGSTFWIEFPLGRTAAGELPAPSQGEGGALKIDRSIRILIAEDNPINQQLAARLLRSLALTNIRFANNGKQALEMAQSEHFDLILMDSQMPEMDGHDATREIRLREGDGRQVRIIGLSALAMQSDRWKAIDAGMDDYLTKPVRREDLARMLKEWFPKTDTPGSASPPPLS